MDSGLNIIVVEDHDDLREITIEALCVLNHRVKGVASAEMLDEVLEKNDTDILVLDLNLPGEDGISLSRRIRAAQPTIGIIMVTVREQIRDRIEGYGSGADLYLTKPTSIEELQAAIKALARRLPGHPVSPLVPDSVSSEKTARGTVLMVRDYLMQREGKLPRLNALASQFGLSARGMNEAFIQEYGQSISAFINDYRLTQAHAALMQSDTPMKQLAARLGYSHVNHFINAFKRKFGYSPGSLRKSKVHSERPPSAPG
ncbi:MAG: response regulator transcription factor [Methylococcaceae bacterium]